MSTSRRNFIRTVLLSSGAVFTSWKDVAAWPALKSIPAHLSTLNFKRGHALLREGGAMPKFNATGRRVDVAVIGGGMAGLAAAWHAKKEHRNVVVIENEASLGGTMRYPVPTWHGIPYPQGASYFFRYDDLFKKFYRDIGATPYETAEDAMYVARGEAVVDWWNPKVIESLPYPQNDRDAFRKFTEVLMATQVPTYPLRQAYDESIKKYDAMTARSWVDQFGSQILTAKLDSYARSVLGAPLSDVNAYSFLNFYSKEFGMAFDLPCHTFAGGLGEIAERGQEWLGSDHLITNALVVNVENREADRVIVQWIDQVSGLGRSLDARSVIVATQKNVARHIVHTLPDAQVEAIKKIRYAPYVTIALCCNAPLFTVRAFDFWFSDPKNRFTDIIDVTSTVDIINGTLGRKTGDFVYLVSSPRPETERASVMDDAKMIEFAQTVARGVDEFVPGALEKIKEMHVFGWGHSMVIPAVGSHEQLAPLISRSHGNIHFANADNDQSPSVESAFQSGIDAAGIAVRSK